MLLRCLAVAPCGSVVGQDYAGELRVQLFKKNESIMGRDLHTSRFRLN